MERHILRPGPNDHGKRLDRILRVCFPAAPLSAIFAALRKGEVRVNGKKARRDYRVTEADEISVKKIAPFFRYEAGSPGSLSIEESENPGEKTISAESRAQKLSSTNFFTKYIIFEDEHFLVLNKPWGVLSHGPASLAEDVAAYLAPVLPPSLAFSPGPLHRLDRNTTGIIFFSKSLGGARFFSSALRAGTIRKTYYALIEGRLETRQTWTDTLVRDTVARVTRSRAGTAAGKTAVSEVRPIAPSRDYTLCEITIQTGRTHQIRAQGAARGHPLAADRKYGGRPLAGIPHGAYILHAAELLLPRASLSAEVQPAPLLVRAPLPEDAKSFLSIYMSK